MVIARACSLNMYKYILSYGDENLKKKLLRLLYVNVQSMKTGLLDFTFDSPIKQNVHHVSQSELKDICH